MSKTAPSGDDNLDRINAIVNDVVHRLESIDKQLANSFPRIAGSPANEPYPADAGDFQRTIQLKMEAMEVKQRQLTE